MKRSAAPSQKGLSKKLTKFVTPYRRSDVSTSQEQDDSPLSLNSSSTTQATTTSEQRSSTATTSSPLKNPELNAISTSSSSLHLNQIPPVQRPPSQKLKFSAPLQQISSNSLTSTPNITKKSYFSVVWCKRSAKKHKNWEGDAVLIVSGRSVSLLDTDGKEIGKAGGYKLTELSSLKEGETLMIGGKEIEVMGLIDEETYLSGKCFGGSSGKSDLSSVVLKVTAKRTSTTGAKLFLNQTDASAKSTIRELKPRFDPSAPDALVLSRPSSLALPKGTTVVDVVVDPHVSQHLRPHQRDGVNFLYECVMGYKDTAHLGAILADEMGLGKTLQVIALLWTLLKQNPFGHKPVIRRALIVTPGSLVKNWMKEFKKWLGMERLNVFAVSSDKKAEEFKNASIYPVMIVSYEMFVRYCDVIKQTNFDLLICDEGHRLKNSSIKTTSFLQSVGTRRRIVVTGTPIQNDLKEFFTLVDFCNPGLLGSQSSFHKVYEDPILKSKQLGCVGEEKKVGEERAKELNRITSSFILRRTSDVNEKYLPEKTEYVVFCKPTDEQTHLYKQILSSCQLSSLVTYSGDGSAHLTYINDLKKICNHPCLYSPPQSESRPEAVIPDESGKLRVVCSMLKELHCHNTSKEKITLVSNYTKTLDVLENVCKRESYQYLRLDGQTLVSKRQQLVDNFNSPSSPFTVFLLSSKAGGVGLNLIGANRLVLYDIDWNPANDLQAMARVWRDGQKKPVYIYRLLTTGTIEEKIYQRQVSKQVLGNSVVDSISATEVNFSQDDLKDLFTFHPNTTCDTHDMLVCQCHTNSIQSQAPIRVKTNEKLANLCMSELNSWKHLSAAEIYSHIKDKLVHQAVGDISFMFASQTLTAKETS